MTEFRYDTQLLIEGENLDEDTVHDHFTRHFKGDCLLAVGMKSHQNTFSHKRTLAGTGILCGTGGNFRYRGGGYGPAGARLKGLRRQAGRKKRGKRDIGYFRRL